MIKKIFLNILPVSLITIFILVSFVFQREIASQNHFFPYILEAIWVILTLIILRESINFNFKFSKLFILENIVLLIFGFVLCRLTVYLNLTIPINKSDTHTLLFLLIISPILEEMVFRKGLFISLSKIVKNRFVVIILTSLMFSYAHFQYFFSTGRIFEEFIIYQSFYTFVIALWFGFRVQKTNSIGVVIILHGLFNLGFLIGLFTI